MYKVSRSFAADGAREGDIVAVSRIQRSVHLIPMFGEKERNNKDWTSANVLDKCDEFYLNDFKDRSTHFCLY